MAAVARFGGWLPCGPAIAIGPAQNLNTTNPHKEATMKLATLNDLLLHELRDLYSAEQQLTKALPKMIDAAHSEALKKAFHEHLDVTERQVERLNEVFKMLDRSSRGPRCEAMEGLLKEGQHLMHEDADPAVMDAGLIAAAQRVEHYEIAGYGCARTFARLLGHEEVAELLQQTLDEEAEADAALTELAVSEINVQATVGASKGDASGA
jgi:ferritin-like metal-binding protein YciE